MEKILCLSFGLSAEEIHQGKESFRNTCQDPTDLEVIGLDETMMDIRVGEVLEKIERGWKPAGEASAPKGNRPAALGTHGYRVLMVHTLNRETVLQMLRAFKAVLPHPRDLIFAVITETARGWTFREYLGHLAAEHESMKGRASAVN